jgi:hypothetical protein
VKTCSTRLHRSDRGVPVWYGTETAPCHSYDPRAKRHSLDLSALKKKSFYFQPSQNKMIFRKINNLRAGLSFDIKYEILYKILSFLFPFILIK